MEVIAGLLGKSSLLVTRQLCNTIRRTASGSWARCLVGGKARIVSRIDLKTARAWRGSFNELFGDVRSRLSQSSNFLIMRSRSSISSIGRTFVGVS